MVRRMDAELRRFLLDPRSYGFTGGEVSRIETHISEVFLVGDRAYKVKKAVRLPFLDFSTVEARGEMCEREVMLNRRYATTLYEGVTIIGRENGELNLAGRGEIVDYAVRMRRFRDSDLWSHRIAAGTLDEQAVVHLIRRIAAFHHTASLRPEWGSFEVIQGQILRNIEEIPHEHRHRAFAALAHRLDAELMERRALITKRHTTHVHDIHGDLHLGNITFLEDVPLPFDGIEFSVELGSGDAWSDLGFLTMDLSAHKRPDLAVRAVNTYLEESDDFEGVPLLPLYAAYRALVRAKVHLLSGSDTDDTDTVHRYLDTATDALERTSLHLIAIGGFSGSGKTTLARALAARLGAVVIRTDVIRKHILGLRPLEVAPESGYTAAISREVYRGLRDRARLVAPRGGVIILDGVHRLAEERAASEALAAELGAPFFGLWCEIPQAIALKRVELRTDDASNAHRGVIERQYSESPGETAWLKLDTSGDVAATVSKALEALHGPSTTIRPPSQVTGELMSVR